MVKFRLSFWTKEMISISTSHVLFPSSNISSTPAYGDLSFRSYDMPRFPRSSYECFILRVTLLSCKLLRDTSWNTSIVIQVILWSIRGSHSAIWSFHLTNVKWNSDPRPAQLQWLANRSDFSPFEWPWYRAWPSGNYECFSWITWNECGMLAGNAYPSWHLVMSLFETCLCSNSWGQFSRACRVFPRRFTLDIPRNFLVFSLRRYVHCHSSQIDNLFFVIGVCIIKLGQVSDLVL